MFKRYWWMLLVMAPVGMMAGFLVAAVVTYVMPKKYESQAIIEVKPRTREDSGLVSSVHSAEFEIIKSRNSLSKVIDSLDLTNRWGVDRETAVQILKGIVQTDNIRGTDLIQIRVRHTNKEDARDLAAEVARSYRDYRKEVESKSLEKGISELKKAVREQEDRVEERRKAFMAISGGRDIENEKKLENEILEAEKANEMRRMMGGGLESRSEIIISELENLRKYKDEQLFIYASTLDYPDYFVSKTYPQYLNSRRKIDNLMASGLGHDHPSYISEVKNINELEDDINEGIKNLISRLEKELGIENERLAKESMKKSESRKRAAKPENLSAEYAEAMRDFESEIAMLKGLKVNLISMNILKKLPNDTIVVHEDPVIAESPISPNVTLNLVAGAGGGVLISPFLALPLMWWMNRRKK